MARVTKRARQEAAGRFVDLLNEIICRLEEAEPSDSDLGDIDAPLLALSDVLPTLGLHVPPLEIIQDIDGRTLHLYDPAGGVREWFLLYVRGGPYEGGVGPDVVAEIRRAVVRKLKLWIRWGRSQTQQPNNAADPTGLFAWAGENLTGKARQLVELLAAEPNGVPLADLAVKLDWSSPVDNAFNSLRGRVNRALARGHRGYHIERRNNAARLVPSPARRSAKKH